MGFFQSVGDVVNTISKWGAGQGSGITKAMRSSEQEIAQNLANSKLVGEFNGFGFKANKEIKLATLGKNPEKIFKAGDTVYIRNADELSQLQQQGFKASSVAIDKEAELKSIEKYQKLIQNYKDFQNSNRTLDNEALRAMYNRKDKPGIGYGNLAKGYFGDETYGGKRIGTVLGAGAATAVGVRYLSGGNLTTNAQGERDIAGIPFI